MRIPKNPEHKIKAYLIKANGKSKEIFDCDVTQKAEFNAMVGAMITGAYRVVTDTQTKNDFSVNDEIEFIHVKFNGKSKFRVSDPLTITPLKGYNNARYGKQVTRKEFHLT